MQQPFPLPVGWTIDLRFDYTELLADGDTIATYPLTGTGITIVSSTAAAGYVTFFARWTSGSVGASGYVDCLVTSAAGRVMPARMSFLATAYAP